MKKINNIIKINFIKYHKILNKEMMINMIFPNLEVMVTLYNIIISRFSHIQIITLRVNLILLKWIKNKQIESRKTTLILISIKIRSP